MITLIPACILESNKSHYSNKTHTNRILDMRRIVFILNLYITNIKGCFFSTKLICMPLKSSVQYFVYILILVPYFELVVQRVSKQFKMQQRKNILIIKNFADLFLSNTGKIYF